MARNTAVILYALALLTVVVSADLLFLRHRFWARLLVNVGIVSVFAVLYLTILKRR